MFSLMEPKITFEANYILRLKNSFVDEMSVTTEVYAITRMAV